MVEALTVVAAVLGALFGSWMLLFLKYGRKMEAQEAEIEEIELKLPAERTPLEIHKLELWEKRQSFLEKYKYRLLIGLLSGASAAVGYVVVFMQDPASGTMTIISAAAAGFGFGLGGAALGNEMRERA